MTFVKEGMSSVRIGCRAESEEVESERKAMDSANMKIPLYQAKKHSTRFALEFERLA